MTESVINFCGELFHKRIDFVFGAQDTFFTEHILDAAAKVFSLFRGKKHSGTCTYDSTTEKSVQ